MIKLGSKGKVDPFILGILGITALIIVGVVLVAFNSTPENQMTAYESSQSERPRIKVEKTNIELGDIKIFDKIKEEIIIKNIGDKTLQISNVYTSCGCTSAQIIINNEESPMFSMHNNPAWMGEIEPGGKATLKAIYEPSKMPVQGEVERTIFFRTNDPEKSEVKVNLKARVH